MKKLFLLILAALFVFSCGGGKGRDTEQDDSDADTYYEPEDLDCYDCNGESDDSDSDTDETNDDDSDGNAPADSDPDEEHDGEHDDHDSDTDTDVDLDEDHDEDEPEPVDTSTVEWNGKVGTVSVTGDELRTYTLTTNAKLRNNDDPHQRTVSETAGSPILRSGNTMLDALFALAITELNENKVSAISDYSMSNGDQVPCDCFETGANWHYVWTRDTAYAVHSAVAFFEPRS